MIHAANLYSNDTFQRLKHRTCRESVHWVGPRRSFPEVDRIVVSVGEPEPYRDSSGCFEAQRVDQLFAKEPHRRRAEDDDTLIVEPENPLIRTKIEQFCEVQVFVSGRLVPAWLRLHDTPILRLNRESWPILESTRELGGLAGDDAEEPADRFEQTPNGQRYWSSDHQNREGHEQRDASRAGERDQRVNEGPFSQIWTRHVDDTCGHRTRTCIDRCGPRRVVSHGGCGLWPADPWVP